MAKCVFLDDPITKEDWDQINALKFPIKVGQLISRLYERDNEPIFKDTLPPASFSLSQQANGIFLKARLPFRVSFVERHRRYPDLERRRIKIYKVISNGRGGPNVALPEGAIKEIPVRGDCCLMKDGSVRISLYSPTSTAGTSELRDTICTVKPKRTPRILMAAGRSDVVIEIKTS